MESKWEFDSARISTNILMATTAERYFKLRWKEFFKEIDLDEITFTKPNLYVGIWNKEIKEKCISYLSENPEILKNFIIQYKKENQIILTELNEIKRKINMQDINLLEIHKKYIKLWGEQIIYTVISRFAEPAVKNKITNLGITEEDILKIINPKYQGAQFYLKQELNKIAQELLGKIKEEVINKIKEDNLEDKEIVTQLSQIKEKYGWIKSYINFYKDVEIKDLLKDISSILDAKIKFKENKEISKNLQSIPKDIEENVKLLEDIIDMKNEIQNTQALIFSMGNKIYGKVSEKIGIEIQDIEWLFDSEISSLLEGFEIDKKIVKAIIKQRKEGILIFPKFDIITSNPILIKELLSIKEINLDEILGEKKDIDKEQIIKGTYINPKELKGKVFLALSHEDLSNKQIDKEHILITRAVTPEYTPYLNKFKAIIADEGGIASHGAIVAREMEINMIIGTQNATRILKENEEIFITEEGIVKR